MPVQQGLRLMLHNLAGEPDGHCMGFAVIGKLVADALCLATRMVAVEKV